MRPISLYVHVPFCKRRCPYCTFYHVPGRGTRESAFVEAFVREFEQIADEIAEPFIFPTVFFGGGTPSLLAATSLDRAFQMVSPRLAEDAEVTFEANPEDVTEEVLRDLRRRGVNRLSLGIQSMSPRALRVLNRCNASVNDRALEIVGRHFENFSVDVLLGVPDGSRAELTDTLEKLLVYDPSHLSVYCLEPGGVMERDVRRFFDRVDPERAAEEYLDVCDRLRTHGYEHYEISNFARPGYASRHNRVYWDGGDYIGLGPGAHSYVDGERFYNEASIERYVASGSESPTALRRLEPRGDTERHIEDLMLALRTSRGLAADRLDCESSALQELRDAGLARLAGDRLVLTDRGYLVLNEIVLRLCRAA